MVGVDCFCTSEFILELQDNMLEDPGKERRALVQEMGVRIFTKNFHQEWIGMRTSTISIMIISKFRKKNKGKETLKKSETPS